MGMRKSHKPPYLLCLLLVLDLEVALHERQQLKVLGAQGWPLETRNVTLKLNSLS